MDDREAAARLSRGVGRAAVAGTGRGSLDDLYLTEWRSLVRLAALLLGDVGAGEEVVQEAFVRLSAKGGGWDAGFEPAYLRAAVVNLSRSSLCRRVVAARHVPRARDPQDGADQAAVRAFERSAIVAALQRLPRRQREALALRYYGDLSLAEIAVVMGVAVGTVKSTLSRATVACGQLVEDLR